MHEEAGRSRERERERQRLIETTEERVRKGGEERGGERERGGRGGGKRRERGCDVEETERKRTERPSTMNRTTEKTTLSIDRLFFPDATPGPLSPRPVSSNRCSSLLQSGISPSFFLFFSSPSALQDGFSSSSDVDGLCSAARWPRGSHSDCCKDQCRLHFAARGLRGELLEDQDGPQGLFFVGEAERKRDDRAIRAMRSSELDGEKKKTSVVFF